MVCRWWNRSREHCWRRDLIWGFAAIYGKIRKREVLGLGDVKMIAMLGAFLGLEEALLILCVAGFVGFFGGT